VTQFIPSKWGLAIAAILLMASILPEILDERS